MAINWLIFVDLAAYCCRCSIDDSANYFFISVHFLRNVMRYCLLLCFVLHESLCILIGNLVATANKLFYPRTLISPIKSPLLCRIEFGNVGLFYWFNYRISPSALPVLPFCICLYQPFPYCERCWWRIYNFAVVERWAQKCLTFKLSTMYHKILYGGLHQHSPYILHMGCLACFTQIPCPSMVVIKSKSGSPRILRAALKWYFGVIWWKTRFSSNFQYQCEKRWMLVESNAAYMSLRPKKNVKIFLSNGN